MKTVYQQCSYISPFLQQQQQLLQADFKQIKKNYQRD